MPNPEVAMLAAIEKRNAEKETRVRSAPPSVVPMASEAMPVQHTMIDEVESSSSDSDAADDDSVVVEELTAKDVKDLIKVSVHVRSMRKQKPRKAISKSANKYQAKSTSNVPLVLSEKGAEDLLKQLQQPGKPTLHPEL